MKTLFYPRLAADGIRKNKRLYLPYMLTCAGMVMMTYIINYLALSEVIASLRGGETVQSFMLIGVVVMAVFSTVFLFYTNSFLIKRRRREFGLYNILGMEKKNLARILLWESAFTAAAALVLGLASGFLFSKLAELGLVTVLEQQTTYLPAASLRAAMQTAICFAVIFVLLYINNLCRIWFYNAASLLKSESEGEKPPRANWLLGLLGVVLLAAAYYLAVTAEDPMTAINIFLIAVPMVIIATYLIMIFGSVLFCRLLQNNKRYYYKANHFVSVSSMLYRMKRNGAGLASICVLSTMVLVTLSFTLTLFVGNRSSQGKMYPREINTAFVDSSYENRAEIDSVIDDVLKKHNVAPSNVLRHRCFIMRGRQLKSDGSVVYLHDAEQSDSLYDVYVVPLDDYNMVMGKNEVLADDEVLIYTSDNSCKYDVFSLDGREQYRVKGVLTDDFPNPDMGLTDVMAQVMVVVPDIDRAIDGISISENLKWYYCFDTPLSDDEDVALSSEIKAAFRALRRTGAYDFSYDVQTRVMGMADFYAFNGGLFYLGFLLSAVFVVATVLIIYYKQISEGYEDSSRFEIMQKVGMTKKDIRRSINSQLLTVFFLPLAVAGLHLAFAFPVAEKMLAVLVMNDAKHMIFICTTAACFVLFGLFYAVVYRITSNAYFKIAGGIKHEQ